MLKHMTATFVALVLGGCAHGPYPQGGFVFHDVKGPNHAIAAASGDKKGESCASNVLGYVAWGDASIAAAQKAGGVQSVSTVDYSSFGVLGVYTKTCAIVVGT